MSDANKAQIDLWNGRVGEKWAALQVSLDAMLAQATAELQARAVAAERLTVALAPHDREGRVTLGGAIWLVEAFR